MRAQITVFVRDFCSCMGMADFIVGLDSTDYSLVSLQVSEAVRR